MWFIAVEVEQETSSPPPKKTSWIRPWIVSLTVFFSSHFRCLDFLPERDINCNI